MEGLLLLELSIPLYQLALFVLLITFCMLFQRNKLGLAVSYVFVFYWGYFYNIDNIYNSSEEFTSFALWYFLAGVIILLLAIVSFFSKD